MPEDPLSQQTRLATELRASRQDLQLAVTAGGIGIWNYDLKRGTTRWNAQMYRLLGLAPGTGLEDSETFFAFIHPADRQDGLEGTRAVLRAGDELDLEFRIVRADDGRVRWLAARGKVKYDDHGEPVQMIGVNWDITAHKRIEAELTDRQRQLAEKIEELEHTNRELEAYAHAVSHDLKGPLRAVRNYADFLHEDLAATLNGEQKTYLEDLKAAVDQGAATAGTTTNPAKRSDDAAAQRATGVSVGGGQRTRRAQFSGNRRGTGDGPMSIDEQTTAIHVLLVEDNDHDRIAFGRALEKSGIPFKLTFRQRAEDLPEILREGNGGIDVVVVDYDLPGSNGLEAYRSIAHRPGLPPFVMLTGVGSERLAVAALKAGMFDYIVKDPYTYRRLLPLKIKDVTQRHRDRLDAQHARRKFKQAHSELEKLVDERTTELALLVEALKEEIEERRKTEKALRRFERDLRRLSRKTVETQENERRLVAKELHDSIGSSLAAIKFAVEEKLAGMPADPPPGTVSLETILEHLRDTIKEVRRISGNLRPSILDDLGLLATVTWHCRKSGELQSDIRIDTTFDVQEEEIPELNKIVIYRVMQEALHNALRHSRAERVHVRLEKRDDTVRLCVTDDGCGFDLETESDRPDGLTGYGLRGMYDRAEVVGGRLSIDARIGEGTAVCLELPCDT